MKLNKIQFFLFVVLISFSFLLYGCGKTDTTASLENSQNFISSATETCNIYNIYYGDIHSHTAYSNDAYIIQKLILGINPIGPYGAIQNAISNGLDFVAITDHAEQLDVKNNLYGRCNNEWIDTQLQVNATNGEKIVTFIGWEYTKTAAVKDGSGKLVDVPGAGHKCVIFKDANVPPSPFGATDTNGPNDLWNYLKGYDCITIPHHSARGEAPEAGASWDEYDMSTDWNYIPANPRIQPLVEIFSVHGSSDYSGCEDAVPGFRDERSVESALMKWFDTQNPAYKLGIVGSTDNHISQPGSCIEEIKDAVLPQEGDYTGGLIAVLAKEKNRDSIFEAMRAKRTYATSGPRINLFFTAKIKGEEKEYVMGETIKLDKKGIVELTIKAGPGKENNSKIEKIVITKATKSGVDRNTVIEGDRGNIQFTVNEPTYFRVTAYQSPTRRWDATNGTWVLTNERAWSSPIWIEL